MEWVEITGRTVQEATELALDELGVDESDAEVQVLEEPRAGLFGRTKGTARVKARVVPRQHRPKQERRDRKRPGGGRGRSGGSGGRHGSGGGSRHRDEDATGDTGPARDRTASRPSSGPAGGEAAEAATPSSGSGGSSGRRRRRRSSGGSRAESGTDPRPQGDPTDAASAASDGPSRPDQGDTVDTQTMPLDEHVATVEAFVAGLLDAFELDGSIEVAEIDDETREVRVVGDDLGLLIGPRGLTLQAVHELARTVVFRAAPDGQEGRVRIDIGGYRERRREALERFAESVAESVREAGRAKALEPMSPPDRKVVHDTINGLDGVRTSSEGEEPRRRVVVHPAD